MGSILGVLVAGVVGGLAVAFLISKLQRPSTSAADPYPGMPATDVINMAHIRVAGVGGLGLVAMCAAVAIGVPPIGQSIALSAVLGAVFAFWLIAKRRKAGPMPTSGKSSGANNILAIDAASRMRTDSAGRPLRQTSASIARPRLVSSI
jgi:hypothetical protein